MDFLKRTKIVCTIGPASHSEEQLIALTNAGMNVCRLNFSHGTHEDHALLIKTIRAVRKKTGEPLTILQDLQGPKIRVGELPAEGVTLVVGQSVVFTAGTETHPTLPYQGGLSDRTSDKGQGFPAVKISVTYPNLHKDVQPGQRLLLDDGKLSVKVVSIEGEDVTCEVVDGGVLTSHKGLNLPDTKTSISALSDKDKDDAKFGIEQNVDWIALSFVRSASDIQELQTLLGSSPIKIIAKIEKPEAVEKMDEIIAAVDGIMVARGDLGIEMAAEKVPIIQKELIAKCLAAAKPVIVATQMLESMINDPRATRAEVSDMANAVMDHTDATMLSGETAAGAHPLEAVQTMSATIIETEKSRYDDMPPMIRREVDAESSMTNIAAVLARASEAKAILVASESGHAAQLVSRYRPELPIFAATSNEKTFYQMNISWGVRPLLVANSPTTNELIAQAFDHLKKINAIATGDQIIVVAGEPLGESGHINLVEMRTI